MKFIRETNKKLLKFNKAFDLVWTVSMVILSISLLWRENLGIFQNIVLTIDFIVQGLLLLDYQIMDYYFKNNAMRRK